MDLLTSSRGFYRWHLAISKKTDPPPGRARHPSAAETLTVSVPNGPPPNFGPLVRTGLMILFMVLDQSNYADGVVWANSPNGPGVESGL